MKNAKMSARERIEYLLDEQSFVEIGSLVEARNTDYNLGAKKVQGDGVITGYGLLNGRMVCVYSQDSAALGGSVGEMHARKIVRLYDMAMDMGVPVIGMMDSAGLRLQEGGDALWAFGTIFARQAKASGRIPQICAVLGPCGGGSAVMASLSDFTLMEKENGALFVNSPNVLDGNTAEKLDTSGWEYQAKQAGSVDFACDTEEELLDQLRILADLLPSDYEAGDTVFECTDDLNRIIPELNDSEYDARYLLSSIADDGLFVETKKMYGADMVTALIRLNGETVGAVAVQPQDGIGQLGVHGLKKVEKFIRFCDAFSLPVLTVTDVRGMKAEEAEEREIAAALAGFVSALSESTVPKVNLITGEAFGTAGIVMNSRSVGADFVLAWPEASVGMMDAEQAVRIMYAGEIGGSADQTALIAEKTKEYQEMQSSALAAAKRGYVDDIIVPDATRKRLIMAFEMLEGKRQLRDSKKHAAV